MSKIFNQILTSKKQQNEKYLSIFLTAGFPEKDDTVDIILQLAENGVDFIELGIPFSDPIADGPVIQKASDKALTNGIRLKDVLNIVKKVRESSDIPVILMGYLNPIHTMGIEMFLNNAKEAGVDGLIIPDWPYEESHLYLEQMQRADIDLIHLIAPNTPKTRIREIDTISTSFIYCVAYTGVTGQDNRPTRRTTEFFKYLNQTLKHPWIIGFGVNNHRDFQLYTQYSDGVIIGSAFIQLLETTPASARIAAIRSFIRGVK
ncbi:MAG: tryptophan synthase subunit alpha [Candidatus Marinimicrobia bacterium]|nr:tryptophan synthase subunit alpha [Candidatus Neomarinimicrobiota bacterium]